MPAKPNLVLIGNGMAGAKLLEELIKSKLDHYSITVFGNEPYGSYNRVLLSPLLAGDKSLSEIIINHRDWYTEHGILLHAGADKEVIKIDRKRKTVIAKDGTHAQYDRLVIATGSNPFVLPIEGVDLEGVMSFRDVKDVNTMLDAATKHKKATVIGAGLLGLEAAVGLSNRGMDVTVIHNCDIPLNRQLDDEAGLMLKEELESRGLQFLMETQTHSLEGENGKVKRLKFADGSKLETDLVVMAIGVRPNFRLAKESGLYCENGIVVTDTLQTYDPNIYALGECIQHRGNTFGLVAPLYDQAKVLANHLSEHGVARYQTLPTATKLKVTDINLFSVGDFLEDEDTDTLTYRDKRNGIYKKLFLQGQTLKGAVLYGETQDGPFYQDLIDEGKDITKMRAELMFGQALCQSMQSNQESSV